MKKMRNKREKKEEKRFFGLKKRKKGLLLPNIAYDSTEDY